VHWWERPPFEIVGKRVPDGADIQERVRENTERSTAFQAMLGDRLSDERRHIYRDVLRAMPTLFQRLTSPHALTIVHSDVHIGNFLYPRDPHADKLRIIDWQTWNIGLVVKDLVYMMAYFWFPERRTRYEQPLLHYYHERLHVYGVTNYAWQTLWDDYRLCVIRMLFHPAWQW
jgi:thiamine kinase-like enzyme